MNYSHEDWTDAELVAHCRSGDVIARQRLVTLYIPAMAHCIALSRHRHWSVGLEVIEDAAQEVFFRLWQAHDQILANFSSQKHCLVHYLAHLMYRQVDDFLRQDRLEHRRRQRIEIEPDEPRCGPGLQEEQAERVMACLSPTQRTVLQGLLDRTLFDQPNRPSKGALRILIFRIRRKVEGSDRQDTA